jgi:hypothetical protein
MSNTCSANQCVIKSLSLLNSISELDTRYGLSIRAINLKKLSIGLRFKYFSNKGHPKHHI